tara:strand:+ start:174 stop:401 length:228 start_codon:yes stop_codon:yes gene_type:complete
MAKSKIVRTWGSAKATTQAFFIDIPVLIKKSLISNNMSELDIARVRAKLRQQIHYPFARWGHITTIPEKHELEDK